MHALILKTFSSISVLVLFALIITACGHVDEETPRGFVSRVVVDTQQERNQIASELLAGRKSIHLAGPLILKNRDNIKSAAIDFGWISTTGTLIAHSK